MTNHKDTKGIPKSSKNASVNVVGILKGFRARIRQLVPLLGAVQYLGTDLILMPLSPMVLQKRQPSLVINLNGWCLKYTEKKKTRTATLLPA